MAAAARQCDFFSGHADPRGISLLVGSGRQQQTGSLGAHPEMGSRVRLRATVRGWLEITGATGWTYSRPIDYLRPYPLLRAELAIAGRCATGCGNTPGVCRSEST